MKKLIALGAIIISTLIFSVKPIAARSDYQTVKYAINLNWCGHAKRTCRQGRIALKVAWCESRLKVYASNGQYRGIFQMGSHERNLFGHGNNAWDQARAARKYQKQAGWRPWPVCASGYY